MLVSIKLLKMIIPFNYTAEEVGNKLSMLGLEVEGIRKVKHKFENIITGKVLEIQDIPNTKLKKTLIDTKTEKLQIVTTATNLKSNDVVPVALPHSKVANGTEILERDFKGMISQGMLCSYAEIGLDPEILSSEEKEGIFTFPLDTPIGKKVEDVLPIDDDYLELSLLPDRADAFYLVGLARWIEIIKAREEKRRADFAQFEDHSSINIAGETPIPIYIEDKTLCPFYSGRLIKNVTVSKSSLSLRQKLFMLRIRPINNVVDITNFVLRFYGQPLHTFDADTIQKEVIIRRAKKGERIKTLDEVERKLTEDNLVIADERGPIAIAGVMGGYETSVTEKTKNVFLESAYFSPHCIAKSARSLGIVTDASDIFERGADPLLPPKGSIIASNLISKEAKGIPAKENVVSFITPAEPVNLRLSRVEKILGERIDKEYVKKYFDFEGFDYKDKGEQLEVIAPSFRRDIEKEIDLIEEIVRMKGYNEFGEALIVDKLKAAKRTDYEDFIWKLKDKLVKIGLDEVQTVSLTSESLLNLIGYNEKDSVIKLLNPLSSDMSLMRPLLLSTLLPILERNKKMGNTDIAMFEIGKVFKKEEGFKETDELGILLSGKRTEKNYLKVEFAYSFPYLKGIFEDIFSFCNIAPRYVPEQLTWMHPYQSAGIYLDKERIGYIGRINDDILEKIGVIDKVFYGAVNVEKLMQHCNEKIQFKPFSLYPPVKRDIAIVVDEDTPEEDVRKAIISAAPPELKKIVLFDLYKGTPLPPNKKNLAYSLEFSSVHKTLKGEDINKFIDQLEKVIKEKVNGKLRKE